MSGLRNMGWSLPIPQHTVAFGIPIANALNDAVQRLSVRRVAVVTTNSLAGSGGLAESLCKILGPRVHSTVAGIRPHSPREGVIRVVKALEGADGVVTIGGGSVCDSVKAARLCLANGITDVAGIDRLRPHDKSVGSEPDPTLLPTLPFIAVPTTLAAGEFTSGAGITDERGPVKQVFIYPGLGPDIVILDPEMARATPPRLWFSSGIRALDHAVETWCSTSTTPISDAYSLYAARLLIVSLRKVFDAPDDLQARLDCMKGAWLSIIGLASGTKTSVKAGASHGLGHALGGTAGMPHGETSCVMLPHVLRYNASINADRQAVIGSSIGDAVQPLASLVEGLVSHLGLPGRLRDAGVSESVLEAVARAALHDPLMASNPRPIESITEIRQLLRQAW
jgi:maleylacetate reductase